MPNWQPLFKKFVSLHLSNSYLAQVSAMSTLVQNVDLKKQLIQVVAFLNT
jgi:hypothetical protein